MHINLFTTLYDEPDKTRRKEIQEALMHNLKNKNIDNVVAFVEGKHFTAKKYQNAGLTISPRNDRPTYNDFKDLIKVYSGVLDDRINIVANNDIYFNDTIKLLDRIDHNTAYALTRWEYNESGDLRFWNHGDSQDAWVFRGAPKSSLSCDASLGVPGCDNRFAYELQQAGYTVLNPSRSIQIIHHHATQIRHYNEDTPKVAPPYIRVEPTDIDGHKQKILHVSLDTPANKQDALHESLKMLGKVETVFYQQHTRPADEIVKVAEAFRPDIVFMQLQKKGVLSNVHVQELRRRGAFVINWTGDVRQPLPQWYISLGLSCNLSLFVCKEDVKAMRRSGCNADFMQIGFDYGRYNPEGSRADVQPIVFLANHYGDTTFGLSMKRKELVRTLQARYGRKFGLYGRGWQAAGIIPDGDAMGSWQEEAAILRGAKVVINYSHYRKTGYSSDRLLRAAGCGAFIVSHEFPDIGKQFRGLHMFRTYDEMFELIDRALTDEDWRQQEAFAFHRHCVAFHTWHRRMNDLQRLISQYSKA